jgi:prevent-host-death family protein
VKERAISVTEAARNFADCINRVRYQHISFVLLKNGTPVARLIPAGTAQAAQAEEETVALPALPDSQRAAETQRQAAIEPSESTNNENSRRGLQW